MKIQIDLQKEDWKLYQAYIEKELPKQYKNWMDSFWLNLLVWMIITISFMVIFNKFSHFNWPTAISVAVFFVLIFSLFYLNLLKIRKVFEPLESGIFCGSHKFTFSSEGVASEGNGYKGYHSWHVVKKIERTHEMILIFLDKAYVIVFPESKLNSPDEFYQYISEQFSNITSHLRGRG